MNLFKSIVKVLLAVLVYFIVQAAAGAFLPMSPALSAIPEGEKWMVMPALLLVGLVYSLILLFYCRRSSRRTIELMPLVALVLFTVATFQSQVETLYFRKAFTVLSDGDLATLFVHGFITSIVFAPLAVLIFRKGAKPGTGFPEAASGDPDGARDYDFDRRWWKYLLAALAYLPFYFGFGMLAQLAPVLGATYAAWIADTSLLAFLPLWQVFRGALFMGIAVLVISLFPKRAHAAIALSASFSLFISISLAFPSVIMPQALRLVHFCEITSSMVLYSLCVVALLTRPKAAAAR
jgi:hypothetical protein